MRVVNADDTLNQPGLALAPASRSASSSIASPESVQPEFPRDAGIPRASAGSFRARGVPPAGRGSSLHRIPAGGKLFLRAHSEADTRPQECQSRTGWLAADVMPKTPSIRLELESRPETVTLVRGMLGGIAETLAFDPELLDDVKTAVSEACNNVVLHAYAERSGPLAVLVYVDTDEIEVIIRDTGCGIAAGTSRAREQGVGLPVIRALAARSEFRDQPGGGTEVRMVFSGSRDGKRLFQPTTGAVAGNGWSESLAGDAVVCVSPVALLTGVLGRIARALAATARFSLDRFSDVYLVTDAIAKQAATAASEDAIGFSIRTSMRRLELTVGPFRPGTAASLHHDSSAVRDARSPLVLLADELAARPLAQAEMLHAVLVDRPRWS
jgi:serine/threonine-protein kinase RsbW